MMMIYKFSKSSFIFISTLIVIQLCLCFGYGNVSDSGGSRANNITNSFSTINNLQLIRSTTNTLASMTVHGIKIINPKNERPSVKASRVEGSRRSITVHILKPKKPKIPGRQVSSQRADTMTSKVPLQSLPGNEVTTNSSQVVNATTSKKLPSSTYAPTKYIELINIANEKVPFTPYENLRYTETTSPPDTFTRTFDSSTPEERTTTVQISHGNVTVLPAISEDIQPPYFYRHLEYNNSKFISSTSTAIPQISPTSSKVDSSKVIHPTTKSSLKKSKSIPKPIPETPVQYGGPKSQLSHGSVQVLPNILDGNLLSIPRPSLYQDLYPYPYLDYKHSNSRYENSNRRMEEIYKMNHPDKYAGQINPKQTQAHLTDSEKLVRQIVNSEPAVKKEMVKKILELFLQNQANQKQVFMQVTPTPQFPPTTFYS